MSAQETHAGTLDPDFGENGIVFLRGSSGTSITHALDIATGSDDSIFVALTVPQYDISIGASFGLAKLRPDGAIDNTFGVEGYAVYPGRGGTVEIPPAQAVYMESGRSTRGGVIPATIFGVAASGVRPFVLPNGKILLQCELGVLTQNLPQLPFLAQFEANGALDQGFGDKGTRYFDFQDEVLDHATVIPMPDGKIVMVCRRLHKTGEVDGLIIRLDPNGQNDPSFGNGGIVPVSFPGGREGSTTCAVVQEGTYVVGGNNQLQALLRRFSGSGEMDVGFGKEGTCRVPEKEDPESDHPWFDQLLLTDNDDFIGIGAALIPDKELFLRRAGFIVGIDRNGHPNPDFAKGMPILTLEDTGQSALQRGILDAAGRLVVGGQLGGILVENGFVVGRYSSTGVPDESFGRDGCQVISLGVPTETARGLGVQSSGKVILSGQVIDTSTPWVSRGVIMRLLPA